ncbi:MAG: enoyl-CoA hydratase-related protein [Candidatus Thermoplasmatota archaeon]|nr:enoyl-CoA hydratase-related protein [Candidatus Thermoplasmatota archaeon]
MTETVRLETKDDVAVLTIDRPKALNALNEQVLTDLVDRIDEAIQNEARCIVLTGEGKAFVAGADIKEMSTMSSEEARRYSIAGHEVLATLEDLHIPLIAAVNGFALGGGMELALACDIRIAAESAQFGLPEVTLGVIPGFGGTQRLSRITGMGPALDLVLTGRRIDAQEAHRLNIVTHVVPDNQVLAEAIELGQSIANNGPVAVQLAKKAVRNGYDGSLDAGDALEAESFAACFATEDQKEGMQAFLEKREADFQGK